MNMLELAKQIVDHFEKDYLIITDIREYEENIEDLSLYLSAKAYIKRYDFN